MDWSKFNRNLLNNLFYHAMEHINHESIIIYNLDLYRNNGSNSLINMVRNII